MRASRQLIQTTTTATAGLLRSNACLSTSVIHARIANGVATTQTSPLSGLRFLPSSFQGLSRRNFASSSCFQKKGGKQAREEKRAESPKDAQAEDPFDFSTLEKDIANVLERLKTDLSKLRAGGRFNPEVLEVLRVQPNKAESTTVKLGDLAQVIPKGRTVHIMVGEKDHVKPVTSAIQSSNLSLTPQPDPTGHNANLLVINIPPPTTESRRAAVADATKAGEKASMAMRDARGKQQKKQRAMQKDKSVRPDDLKKAGSQMEKIAEAGAGEIKKIVDGAKKVLESG
ncbi:Hypothetical protein R9X50_00535300 [Acrodontium crateriforme]|uniref:Ribosome recycling factor domain-containing protein n=1 Tax=Acrodontium crateriforme TaxID=150365 RepID=A0AAQ3RD69_9PEZI|nr:Hypothetical protein R9X50_00535300 [Acrodontium crateriforme]